MVEYKFSGMLANEEAERRFRGSFEAPERGGPDSHVGAAVVVAYDPREPERSTLVWHDLREDER